MFLVDFVKFITELHSPAILLSIYLDTDSMLRLFKKH
jgi:hypothetical protein